VVRSGTVAVNQGRLCLALNVNWLFCLRVPAPTSVCCCSGGGNSVTAFGGRGAYAEAVISVTIGAPYFLITGQGGFGIGSGPDMEYLSGGGGGGTAILLGSIPLLVAGGGGGAGSDVNWGFTIVRRCQRPPAPCSPFCALCSRAGSFECDVCR
jgi:hypothetical protein